MIFEVQLKLIPQKCLVWKVEACWWQEAKSCMLAVKEFTLVSQNIAFHCWNSHDVCLSWTYCFLIQNHLNYQLQDVKNLQLKTSISSLLQQPDTIWLQRHLYLLLCNLRADVTYSSCILLPTDATGNSHITSRWHMRHLYCFASSCHVVGRYHFRPVCAIGLLAMS